MIISNLAKCLYRKDLTDRFISIVLGEYYGCGEDTLKESKLPIDDALVTLLTEDETDILRLLFMRGQGGHESKFRAERMGNRKIDDKAIERAVRLLEHDLVTERTAANTGTDYAADTRLGFVGDNVWSGYVLTLKGYILVYQTFTQEFKPSVVTSYHRVPDTLPQLPKGTTNETF